jgi:hypothetical protein
MVIGREGKGCAAAAVIVAASASAMVGVLLILFSTSPGLEPGAANATLECARMMPDFHRARLARVAAPTHSRLD